MDEKKIPLTRRGAAFLGGALGLVVCGLSFQEGIFLVLGSCFLVLLFFCYVLGKWNLSRAEAKAYLPKRATAGRLMEVELSVRNRGRYLDLFSVRMKVLLPAKLKLESYAAWTATQHASRVYLKCAVPVRCHLYELPIQLTSAFPLGFFTFKKTDSQPCELIVTPRAITPRELNERGSLHDAQPMAGQARGNTFGELRGIRIWQPGDSARFINWSASARAIACGHDLRVREFDPPGFHPEQCHIIFHSYASGGEILREDRFERALSLLAGTLTELQQKGVPSLLVADFFAWDGVVCQSRLQLLSCLKKLASVTRAKGTEAHDLEKAIRAVSPDHALIIISDMPPESWLHMLVKHPEILAIDIRQIRHAKRTLKAAG